jgi:DNA-binding IclR family transcriptional regulator
MTTTARVPRSHGGGLSHPGAHPTGTAGTYPRTAPAPTPVGSRTAPGPRAPFPALPAGPRPGAPDGGVKSVTAALDALDCFVEADELGVSDIARRLGVAKSTAHRMLTSLCASGLTERNPETGQYRLGLHLLELGQLAANRMRLRRAALPLLEELRQVSGCTVDLAVPAGADVVYVERLETRPGTPLMHAVGRRQPSHCTSSGKAMAAYDDDLARARRAAGFPALTARSIRTVADYDRVLAEVRRRGVAISVGELSAGLSSVAAPVLDASGRARAAVSLIGVSHKLSGDLGRASRLVSVAAQRLTRTLAP